MPIAFTHHPESELNRIVYSGALALADLEAVASYMMAQPASITFDCLSIITPDTHLDVPFEVAVDEIFAQFGAPFEKLTAVIMRRSAWLCLNPEFEPLMRQWLERVRPTAPNAEHIRLFFRYEDAATWLLADAEALQSGQGFHELARFGAAA